MRDDEKRFLVDVYQKCHSASIGTSPSLNDLMNGVKRITPRDLINEPDFYIHHKRVWYLLEKWSKKGWYEWGVTMDLGWILPKGKDVAEGVLKSQVVNDQEKPQNIEFLREKQ